MDADVPIEVVWAQARLRARNGVLSDDRARAIRAGWLEEVRKTGHLDCTWPGLTLAGLTPKQRVLHDKLEAELRAELAAEER